VKHSILGIYRDSASPIKNGIEASFIGTLILNWSPDGKSICIYPGHKVGKVQPYPLLEGLDIVLGESGWPCSYRKRQRKLWKAPWTLRGLFKPIFQFGLLLDKINLIWRPTKTAAALVFALLFPQKKWRHWHRVITWWNRWKLSSDGKKITVFQPILEILNKTWDRRTIWAIDF